MQKLKKIDETSNMVTWFEIPVVDIDRSKAFYETILNITMVKRADGNDESVFFRATAGGKVIVPQMEIPAGFIAIIIDSEGIKLDYTLRNNLCSTLKIVVPPAPLNRACLHQ